MPRKIQSTTKADLTSVPLPNHGASYTVISHQFVIDYAYQALANAGFTIVDEEYRCTADGQIAQGIYKLNFNNDPELSMMFAWTNSYNKQVKFKCVVGAYINNTGSVMISGEVGSWVRKHTGSADTETKAIIDEYITNAHMYYTQLCSDKAAMETITLTRRKQSQLLGVLFAEYEILTTEQASSVRDQMKKPYHVFASTDSLWAFYNYVTVALQSSHPKTWMEDQRILHYFISTIGNFQQCSTPAQVVQPINNVSTPVEDPLASNYGQPENQTNLLVQIAEETGDDSVLQAQYPVTTPEEYPLRPGETIPHIDDLTDEQIIQMHSEKGLTLAHYKPTDRFEEESQLSDNQVVQDEVENEEVLHQSEEVVEDVIEDTEIPFDIDEDDDAMLSALLVPIETPSISAEVIVMDLGDPESTPEPLQDYIERTTVEDVDHIIVENEIWTTDEEPQKIATILDETVHYTDPAGNTFEAPVVIDDLATEENLEEEIRETEVANFFKETTPSLEPSPKDYAIFESEQVNGTYALYETNEDQVNLDLKQPEVQLVNEEANLNEFDLDFASDDAEEEEPDNTPDFF